MEFNQIELSRDRRTHKIIVHCRLGFIEPVHEGGNDTPHTLYYRFEQYSTHTKLKNDIKVWFSKNTYDCDQETYKKHVGHSLIRGTCPPK